MPPTFSITIGNNQQFMCEKLTPEQVRSLSERLIGTSDSIQFALDSMGLDSDECDASEIEDNLLDFNVERCQQCDWWCDSSDLVDMKSESGGVCEDCRK